MIKYCNIYKKLRFILSFVLIGLMLFATTATIFAATEVLTVTVSVLPIDATDFEQDLTHPPGNGECRMIWVPSVSPGIDNQKIDISGPGIGTVSYDIAPGVDFLVISGLLIGETYTLGHFSESGVYSSSGIWTTCIPEAALPAPIAQAEPGTTEGSTNTIYFENNGVVDGVDAVDLTCNVRASLEDLALNPFAPTVAESGWIDCKDHLQTYSYTFTSLIEGNQYYYDVQSQDNDPDPLTNKGLSPYSNVVFSTQFEEEEEGGGGGGGRPRAVCGNNLREPGEECDDGNRISGDGCSSTCTLELPECGDGDLDEGEQCDDGNLIDGDGCSSLCEEELLVDVIFDIKGKPEHRTIIDATPNLRLNSQLIFFKHGAGTIETDSITLDSYGLKEHQREIMTGTYDIALNGEAHNTKIIRDIIILETTERVELDFTFADTFELTAGDTFDDNYINALDIARMLGSYRDEGENLNDLTKEEIVNAIDIAVLLWNYRKEGEDFAYQAF